MTRINKIVIIYKFDYFFKIVNLFPFENTIAGLVENLYRKIVICVISNYSALNPLIT